MRPRKAAVLIAAAALIALQACSSHQDSGAGSDRALVRVPADAPTVTKALTEVADGGLVLVSPGTYHESVHVERPGITIRGTNRNSVIFDGEGLKDVGLLASADGVRIENLTVTGYTFYGVLVTGMPNGGSGRSNSYQRVDPAKFPPVQRFLVDHVTAADNGLYGIYAFDSQHGQIRDSYASGSADSGFYVGQCQQCDIVVRGNVAERNAVGFENANASDSVYVIGNRWSGNRVGMTLTSDYQEAFVPQHANVVAGNVISGNIAADSPAQADGGFGIGVGIGGGQQNRLFANRITGNPVAGVLFSNAADIPAKDNQITGNLLADNGANVADVSPAATPSSGNCVSRGVGHVVPAALAGAVCPRGSASGPGVARSALPAVAVPAGKVFLDVSRPLPQPGLTGDPAAAPDPLPAAVPAPDTAAITVPGADLLESLTGTR